MNGQKIDGQEVQVSLAKPPSNKHEASSTTLNQSNSELNNTLCSTGRNFLAPYIKIHD